MLEQLARSNLFIIPLDDERRWYRYHHLFADLLRVRLSQAPPFAAVGAEAPGGIETVLHRRASAWFEEEGLTAEAIDHASAAGDFERTARLIEGNAWTMLMGGETMMLLGWVSTLPDELVRSRPWL